MIAEVLLSVLIIELLLYLLSTYHKGLSSRLSKRGLSVGLFTVMADVGKLRIRVKASPIVRAVSLVAVVNVAILIVVFYWIALPSILNLIKTVATTGEVAESPFVPVVPGVTIRGISLLYFLVGVVVAILVHELAHALVAVNEGIEVRSWGLGVFLVFPFAYVRISDESFSRSSLGSKVRVLAAGVFSNTLVALAVLLFANLITGVLDQYSAVVIYGLDYSLGEDAPAVAANLPTPSVINSINGTPVKTLSDLRALLASIANKEVTLVLNLSRFNHLIDGSIVDSLGDYRLFSVYKPPHYGRLGIYVIEAYLPTVPKELYYLARVSFWVYVINISLAVFNAAPLFVTDGGRIVDEFLSRHGLRTVSKVIQLATVVIVSVLLITGIMNFI